MVQQRQPPPVRPIEQPRRVVNPGLTLYTPCGNGWKRFAGPKNGCLNGLVWKKGTPKFAGQYCQSYVNHNFPYNGAYKNVQAQTTKFHIKFVSSWWFQPLWKNVSHLRFLFPIIWTNKNVPNHQQGFVSHTTPIPHVYIMVKSPLRTSFWVSGIDQLHNPTTRAVERVWWKARPLGNALGMRSYPWRNNGTCTEIRSIHDTETCFVYWTHPLALLVNFLSLACAARQATPAALKV